MLELNRNPDNYFAEVEQAAFSPSNVVPGIGFSPDKMLQAPDLLLRRRPPLPARHALRSAAGQRAQGRRCTPTRDGAMRFVRNDSGNPDAYYEPNCFDGPGQDPRVAGAAAAHLRRRRPLQPPRSATTTSASRAPSSACSTPARRRASSPTSPRRWQGVPDEIVERQCRSSTRSTPTMARACARRSRPTRTSTRRSRSRSPRETPQHAE